MVAIVYHPEFDDDGFDDESGNGSDFNYELGNCNDFDYELVYGNLELMVEYSLPGSLDSAITYACSAPQENTVLEIPFYAIGSDGEAHHFGENPEFLKDLPDVFVRSIMRMSSDGKKILDFDRSPFSSPAVDNLQTTINIYNEYQVLASDLPI